MSNHAKQMPGQLFELNDNRLLSDGDIIITQHQPSPACLPTYDATMSIRGCPSDLDGKTCLLRLSQEIGGQVYLHSPSVILGENYPFASQLTILVITFIGAVWFGSGWFDSLG
jgi:hypothetical protein